MKSLKNLFIPMSIAFGLALVLSQPTRAGSDSDNENADTFYPASLSLQYRDVDGVKN